MPTPISILARERAIAFRRGFVETSEAIFRDAHNERIFHPGEYGSYRERLLKHLLSGFLPGYLETSEGFIVGRGEARSTQADVVIYDHNETPQIETQELRRFFPIETIAGVGEVKSRVSVSELRRSLEKLTATKQMRLACPPIPVPVRPISRAQEILLAQIALGQADGRLDPQENASLLRSLYDPVEHHWQNIVTFLVCAKIDGGVGQSFSEITGSYIREVRSERDIAMLHNMILSLDDGYQSYHTSRRFPVAYPRLWNPKIRTSAGTGIRIVKANDNCDHIVAFVADLCSAITDTAIYPFAIGAHFEIPSEFLLGA